MEAARLNKILNLYAELAQTDARFAEAEPCFVEGNAELTLMMTTRNSEANQPSDKGVDVPKEDGKDKKDKPKPQQPKQQPKPQPEPEEGEGEDEEEGNEEESEGNEEGDGKPKKKKGEEGAAEKPEEGDEGEGEEGKDDEPEEDKDKDENKKGKKGKKKKGKKKKGEGEEGEGGDDDDSEDEDEESEEPEEEDQQGQGQGKGKGKSKSKKSKSKQPPKQWAYVIKRGDTHYTEGGTIESQTEEGVTLRFRDGDKVDYLTGEYVCIYDIVKIVGIGANEEAQIISFKKIGNANGAIVKIFSPDGRSTVREIFISNINQYLRSSPPPPPPINVRIIKRDNAYWTKKGKAYDAGFGMFNVVFEDDSSETFTRPDFVAVDDLVQVEGNELERSPVFPVISIRILKFITIGENNGAKVLVTESNNFRRTAEILISSITFYVEPEVEKTECYIIAKEDERWCQRGDVIGEISNPAKIQFEDGQRLPYEREKFIIVLDRVKVEGIEEQCIIKAFKEQNTAEIYKTKRWVGGTGGTEEFFTQSSESATILISSILSYIEPPLEAEPEEETTIVCIIKRTDEKWTKKGKAYGIDSTVIQVEFGININDNEMREYRREDLVAIGDRCTSENLTGALKIIRFIRIGDENGATVSHNDADGTKVRTDIKISDILFYLPPEEVADIEQPAEEPVNNEQQQKPSSKGGAGAEEEEVESTEAELDRLSAYKFKFPQIMKALFKTDIGTATSEQDAKTLLDRLYIGTGISIYTSFIQTGFLTGESVLKTKKELSLAYLNGIKIVIENRKVYDFEGTIVFFPTVIAELKELILIDKMLDKLLPMSIVLNPSLYNEMIIDGMIKFFLTMLNEKDDFVVFEEVDKDMFEQNFGLVKRESINREEYHYVFYDYSFVASRVPEKKQLNRTIATTIRNEMVTYADRLTNYPTLVNYAYRLINYYLTKSTSDIEQMNSIYKKKKVEKIQTFNATLLDILQKINIDIIRETV